MPYYPLEIPPGTPAEAESVVCSQIDPLLSDIHTMLMLPITDTPGLDAKCGLSAALVLLGVVAGVSATLYDDDPTSKGIDLREQHGEAFKSLLTHRYPWSAERELAGAIVEQHAATVLYEAFRNPLAHSAELVSYVVISGRQDSAHPLCCCRWSFYLDQGVIGGWIILVHAGRIGLSVRQGKLVFKGLAQPCP